MKKPTVYRKAIKKLEKAADTIRSFNEDFPQYYVPLKPFRTAANRVQDQLSRKS